MVNATPPVSLPVVPIVWEARWAPGPVWTSAQNLAPTRIRSSDRSVVSELLHQLRYLGPRFLSLAILFSITAVCIAYLVALWLLLISYRYTVLAISEVQHAPSVQSPYKLAAVFSNHLQNRVGPSGRAI